LNSVVRHKPTSILTLKKIFQTTLHFLATMSFSKPRVLFVLTSHSEMGTSGKATGWYLVSCLETYLFPSGTLTNNLQPEFAHPYHQLKQVAEITVASPAGGAAPVDQGSVDNWKKDEVCGQVWENESSLWKNTEALSTFLGRAMDFAGIFYVGGHGRKF